MLSSTSCSRELHSFLPYVEPSPNQLEMPSFLAISSFNIVIKLYLLQTINVP